MTHSIAIGPVILPGVVLAALTALLSARVVLTRYRTSSPDTVNWILDRGSLALFVAFATWKLWPVLRWWQEIIQDPVILLRLPGGRGGVIAGAVVAAVILVPGVVRDRRRWIPAAAAALALTVGFVIGTTLVGAIASTEGGTGSQFDTELTAEFLSGESQTLLSEDMPTVITFWASWCGPCRAELPVKKRFSVENSESVRFVSVNMTRTEQSLRTVRSFVADHGIEYPVAIDSDGGLTNRFAIRGTPTTIIVDANGSVTARWTGPSSLDRLERAAASAR
ncbi:MAG: TlpA disulfide reductase family protein [Spirochaeta sp.]|jgi:thiol-disulfide isomerase/thioredoxin|nr:TlpA disulfide reductase family protein [Spirochaeta sp.]